MNEGTGASLGHIIEFQACNPVLKNRVGIGVETSLISDINSFHFSVLFYCSFPIYLFRDRVIYLETLGWSETLRSTCLCLSSAVIKGVCHYIPADCFLLCVVII